MACSMRTVRRELRQQLLAAISVGSGDLRELVKIADHLLGQEVGWELLIRTFSHTEVQHGLAQLRLDGKVESAGKVWKLVGNLESEDVDTISTRRSKRLRGELKAEIRLAHEYGRTEDAIAASKMLEIIEARLQEEADKATEPFDAAFAEKEKG